MLPSLRHPFKVMFTWSGAVVNPTAWPEAAGAIVTTIKVNARQHHSLGLGKEYFELFIVALFSLSPGKTGQRGTTVGGAWGEGETERAPRCYSRYMFAKSTGTVLPVINWRESESYFGNAQRSIPRKLQGFYNLCSATTFFFGNQIENFRPGRQQGCDSSRFFNIAQL